jgi:hypothetical protein
MIQFLLDPMEDLRLTKQKVDYEVWHYVFTMEWATMQELLGFELQPMREAYEKGYTPKTAARELSCSAVMRIIDNQTAIAQWANNYLDKPAEVGQFFQAGCQIKVGKDGHCYVLHFLHGRTVVGFVRSTPNAPPPPGYAP